MNAVTDPLWQALETFDLDQPGVALTFSQRLARENGWSHHFAQRVVTEYKRFLYLAMRAGHPVTPSDEVDQAWHLHLVYTRSYWEDLCASTLGQPLHHGPTKGGQAEDTKFHDWYSRTKESYERLFGSFPPADIWPSHEHRFDASRTFRRVDTSSVWMIPKTVWQRPAWVASIFAAAILGGVFLTSCEFKKGGDFSGFVLVLALILAVTALVKWLNHGGRGGGGGSGCSTGGCSGGTSCGSSSSNHHGHSGCSSHHGGSGCGSSGCSSSGCGGGGCGGGGGD